MSSITTAARRIARKINATRARNLNSGFIVVDADGNGGAWYSDNSRPSLAAGEMTFSIDRRASAASIQEKIDARREW